MGKCKPSGQSCANRGKDSAPSAAALRCPMWLDFPAFQPLPSQILQPGRAVLKTGGLSQAPALDFQVSCCVCSSHIKLGKAACLQDSPKAGAALASHGTRHHSYSPTLPKTQVKGQYHITPRMGTCSAGRFFPQTKVSNGDLWVHPHLLTPDPSKCRGVEVPDWHLQPCSCLSGKLSACNKCTGELDTLFILTLPYLPDIGFAPCRSTLLDFHFSKAAQAALCISLFDQVSFLFPSSPVSLFV